MSYDQHLAEVGETQALRNLRFYMFPITPEQCLTAIDDREFDSALRYVSWRYSIHHPQDWDDYSITARCCLLNVPTTIQRVRDWWLIVQTDSLTAELRALRVVFVSSFDGAVAASMNSWLAARVTYRLHCQWQSLTEKCRKDTALTPFVNQQVTAAMRTMPRYSC